MFQTFVSVLGIYFVFCETIASTSAHFRSNSIDLQNLFDFAKNNEVFTSLAHFIETEEANIESLKHLSELLVYDESFTATDVKQLYHPRNVLKIIRQHTEQLPVVVQEIRERSRREVFDETAWNEFLSQLPDSSDLGFFVKGLIRLMDIYELKPETVSIGHILRHRSRGLNLDEIADVGYISTELIFKDSTIDGGDMVSVIIGWLKLGSSLAKASEDNKLRYKLEVALIDIARFRLKRDGCQCSIDMELTHDLWKKNNPGHQLPPYNWTCDANKKAEKCSKSINKNKKEHENICNLCQHKQPVHFKEKHVHLPVEYQYCKLDHNNHPLLLLQPVKVEIRSLYPYNMVEFHDILSDREMDYLKRHIGRNMSIGTLRPYSNKNATVHLHFSEFSYLAPEKHDSPVVKRIRARLSAFSNLTITYQTSERVLLSNYPTTGYIGPHVDFHIRKLYENNRFVTILLYLNDVDGGATVFPFINIRMEARRGRGFMFTNTFRNNIGMMYTRHLSCPVITGDKWIITQWVHFCGQEFSHKCSLKKTE